MNNKRAAAFILLLITLIVIPINSCVTPQPPANLAPTADFTYSPATPTVNQSSLMFVLPQRTTAGGCNASREGVTFAGRLVSRCSEQRWSAVQI